MFRTIKEDWFFIIPTTVLWVLSIGVSTWDYTIKHGMTYRFNSMNLFGLLLFIVGVAIRIIGKITLGKYYSYGLTIKPDHDLVTHGIYRYVRHPIILAAIIYSMAIPLVFSSLYGFVIMLGLVPFMVYRIGIEERMLLEHFGDEYREYIKRTKKMIPFIY